MKKPKNKPLKLYVVRKYIRANSAMEAIRKDKTHPVDDVWVDDTSQKQLASGIGFTAERDND